MKRISEYQKQILIAMVKGVKICTTEGKNYTCWLEKNNLKVRTVRKDSVIKLFDKGLIKSTNENVYPYRYEITRKGRKLIQLKK